MEQLVIDFFAKASELILHNRLQTAQTWDEILDKLTNSNPLKFQLAFNQKFSFATKIPLQWTSHENKLLVLEFFLVFKEDGTKTLVEQWIFDMSQVSDGKLDFTIDSINTLYKKLTVLLRTISLLTATVPLYQKFIKEESSSWTKHFRLEHSINFTHHNLSNWHPSLHEDRYLNSYTSPDFVLPGRSFTFKVNYTKSLNFLHKIHEHLSTIQDQQNKPEVVKPLQEVDLLNKVNRNGLKESGHVRRTRSDNFYDKTENSRNLNINNAPSNIDLLNTLGRNYSQINKVPLILPKAINDVGDQDAENNAFLRRYSEPQMQSIKESSTANRLRIKTLDSETLGENLFILDNDEGKFVEVLSKKEIDLRNTPPTRLSHKLMDNIDVNDREYYRKISEDYEKSRSRLSSSNAKPIEKIIEKTDDDKIAELLSSIEVLKTLAWNEQNEEISVENQAEEVKEESEEEFGLRFVPDKEVEDRGKKAMFDPMSEFEELKDLYLEIKKV